MFDRAKVTQMCQEAIDSGEPQCNYEFYYSVIALLKEQEHKDKMFHALEEDWKRLKELLKEQELEELK